MLRSTLVFLSLSAGGALADDITVTSEAVPDSDVPFNVVTAVVDAPPADIWAIVSKCADFSKTMPRIVKSAELSREGDENSAFTAKCQVTAHLPFPLPDLTSTTLATHKIEPGVKYVREWNLISGDYTVLQGSWTLIANEDGKKSNVTYRIRAKPKIALPTSWIASAQKGALKDIIVRLRENLKKPK